LAKAEGHTDATFVRILYFADIRFPLERANGIQTMETCHALAGRGHDVRLVVRPDTHTPARDPFEYYGLPSTSRLVVERAPARGPQLARRVSYLALAAGRATGGSRADVVMTRDLAVASLLLRLPRRAPIVYESHGYAPEVSSALPELVSTARPPDRAKLARLARREAYVWQHAEGYVTITRGLAESLTARFGTRARLAVVPDGTRITRQQPHGGSPAHPGPVGPGIPALYTLAYAGHLYTWKGVDVLIEAIARVPEVRALIVGGHEQEPDLSRLRALATRLHIEDRVTFTGHLRPPDVARELARADIVALPNPASAISTHSTSPLKLFEYMAAGKAIVASRLPSLGEVLTDEVNALLVTPGDAAALADGIRRLVDDPALRARLGGAAREAVAEYSWDRRAARLEILFNDVLAPTR
jgi:glycosyltransferase involved in cell wall biosynthesis